MKETVVIKLDGNQMVDVIQIIDGDVARMPEASVYNPFPAKELIIFLLGAEMHVSIKPDKLRRKPLTDKDNFIPLNNSKEKDKAFKKYEEAVFKEAKHIYGSKKGMLKKK